MPPVRENGGSTKYIVLCNAVRRTRVRLNAILLRSIDKSSTDQIAVVLVVSDTDKEPVNWRF